MRYFLYNIKNEEGILLVEDNTAEEFEVDSRVKEISSKNIENVYILDPECKELFKIGDLINIMKENNFSNSFLPTKIKGGIS
ncbi:MAG: hypothetical protein ACOCRO_08440 [Halanaerobiales bacterium]